MRPLAAQRTNQCRPSLKNPRTKTLRRGLSENEVTAGELKSRGYYQGSNVSYNLKKMVEMGYMHHQRSEIDRRSVRVCLTEKGRSIRDIVADLFARNADGLQSKGVLGSEGIEDITSSLRRVERYWTDQIRYIY